MRREENRQLWVAVRVERGFPAEAVAFRERSSAEQMEETWRDKMNPDYDETGVLPLSIAAQ
jgi:hypothetical protein